MTRSTYRPVVAVCFIFAAGSSSSWGADIVPLDGKPFRGTVTGVDAQFVSYQDAGGMAARVSVKELAVVEFGGKVATPPAEYDEIELTDGSLFRVSEFRVKGKAVGIGPAVRPEGAGEVTANIPLTTVFYWVRRANDGNTRANWRREVIAKRGKRDMLVLREKREGGDVFQPLEGTVLEGNPEGTGIRFERVDGGKQDFLFSRISGGLLFNQPPAAVIPPTACKVLDVFGNVLYAQAVELSGGVVKVTTVSGAVVEYASTAAVSQLDFSQGNVKYLAEMEPLVDAPPAAEGDPYLPFLTNKTPVGVGFRLGGKQYVKGVWVAPHTRLTYKLDGEYREFKAVVGIDDAIDVASATVTVVVEADGRPLLTQTIRRKDGKPVEVNLNVKDVKQVRIGVENTDLYTGASLNMADARFQK